MADRISRAKRSENMSRIRGADTKPERMVRSIVHGLGYRFRRSVRDLPGKPDIVLPRLRTVILVHGCFWHRHTNCSYATTPKSNADLWAAKFSDNVRRDRRVRAALYRRGWHVLVVWECHLVDAAKVRRRLTRLLGRIEAAEGE